jgi:hypothetical protein
MPPKVHLCMRLWVLTGCFNWSPSLSRESCLMAGRSQVDTGTRLATGDGGQSQYGEALPAVRAASLCFVLDSGVASAASAKLRDSMTA